MEKLNLKRAFLVGGILAAIAGSSALLIAGVNLLTGPTISANAEKVEQNALSRVFGEGATFGEPVTVNKGSILKYWPATDGTKQGRVYSLSGSNSYGTVSLSIGIYDDFSLGNMIVSENTESYGQTLEDNYIGVYQHVSDKEGALDATKCGATFGAALIQGMVEEARTHYKEGN